jgi:hypothetical protein
VIGASVTSRSGQNEPERESRRVEAGHDLLDNNAVNILMAAIMSVGGMILAGYFWEVPFSAILV